MKGLREIRERKNLKLREVEDLTGIDLNTISRYERGVISATVETARKIANALGVSVDELLNGSKENIIEVTLRFEPKLKGGLIDMSTGTGYALTVADNGMVGISGAAIFKTRADLDKALNKIKSMLEEGFARQVEKGLASEE